MNNRIVIDWLAFSVRVDAKANVAFKGTLDLDFFARFLGIPSEEFANCGRVKYYKERYECNSISIAVPFERSESTQGYYITMSGNGCRYFEQNQKDGEIVDVMDIWRGFFLRLRALTEQGLAVKIARIDNAVDDFTGLLDLGRIVSCCQRDCVATRFRTKQRIEGRDDVYLCDSYLIRENFSKRLRGFTVEFGKRTSNSFCRFYDKKTEQLTKHYQDKEESARLSAIPHWVRMEFEFKAESAMKLVNCICDEEDYPSFFAEYVNGMIRFIERDDSNVGRCTACDWWEKFIGTTKRTKLCLGDYKPESRERHLRYVYRMLPGVIYTAINIDGLDRFLENVVSIAGSRLRPKFQRLCVGIERNLEELCSAKLWELLRPKKARFQYGPPAPDAAPAPRAAAAVVEDAYRYTDVQLKLPAWKGMWASPWNDSQYAIV